MARQQLGVAPTNNSDAATKAYVDTAIAGVSGSSASYKTIGTANQWVRIARITMAAQNDGASAEIDLVAVPDSVDTANFAELKIRAGQRLAFGNNPAADIVVMRASTLGTANLGYVVVQNTPTSIVDFYVQIQSSGRVYQVYPEQAVTGTATITFYNQDAGSATTPSGLINGTTSTDPVFFGNASLGGSRITALADPIAAQDAATKNYVDVRDSAGQKAMFDMAPPINAIAPTPGVLINGTQTQAFGTGNGVTGKMSFQPLLIGPSGWTVDAVLMVTTVAQSGGTTTFTPAIYGSDAYGNPDTSNRLALGNSFVLTTAAGNLTATFSTPIALTPSLYWLGLLYVETAAPTTRATYRSVNNSVWPFVNLTANPAAGNIRGYFLSGLSATPTTATTFNSTNFTQSASTDLPQIYVRRSA